MVYNTTYFKPKQQPKLRNLTGEQRIYWQRPFLPKTFSFPIMFLLNLL